MKDTAPIGSGILAVAALFGVIGGAMSYVMWEYTFLGALFLALIIALIVAFVLWLGWRPANDNSVDMAAQAHRAGEAPTVPADGSTAAATVAGSATAAGVAAGSAADATASAAVKTGTLLPGETEFDYDGDGKVEGADEGSKPATLTAARDGGPDDLKQIKGVGPKMEGMLHGMGFFHFDQVAAWSAQEVAWVDANLEGFKGRVSRDNWVEQAKLLAAGGETAFSKKVEKGGVY